jgi:CO dehydrogenase maturation factor
LVHAGVGTHLVANKVQDRADVEAVQRAVPLPLLGAVPYDPQVADAEKFAKAPLDAAPESPAVRAIGGLAALA